MRRFSDRPRQDTAAIVAYWAIWSVVGLATGAYFVAYGLVVNAVETPLVGYAWFGIPLLVGVAALWTNPLLQFRRNSEARYIVSRAREGRRCEPEFFLYLRPFSSDGRIREEGTSLIDNPLKLIGMRTDFEGALTSHLSSKLGLSAIAIGRDKIIGAGRVRLPDDEWQRVVEALIREARLVVLLVSGGAGISWEIEECLKATNLGKTIFVWPPVSKAGGYDPASDKAAVCDIFSRRGKSVTIGSKAGEAFFWDGMNGWRVVDMKWPKRRTLPKPVFDHVKEFQRTNMNWPRGIARWASGAAGVLAVVVAAGIVGHRLAMQAVGTPSVPFGVQSDAEIVARFEQSVAHSPLAEMFARLRTDFPHEYQGFYHGIITIARSGGTEEEQILESNRYSQAFMTEFWQRHRQEMRRAEPEVVSRWVHLEGEALAALGRVSYQACAEYFEAGHITPELAQTALLQVSAEFARSRDVMFDMIESGQRAPQQYEPLTEDEWSALYDAVMAAGANPAVLDSYGTSELTNQAVEGRCQTGIAFYRAISLETDPWKRARLGVALMSDS